MIRSNRLVALFILIACSVAGYFIYSLSSSGSFTDAQDYFLAGKYVQAEETLDNLSGSLPKGQQYLYFSYVARAQGNVPLSNQNLALAEEETDPNRESERLLEIYSNQMLNAYLTNDPTALERSLQKASDVIGKNNLWIIFFSGVYNYMTHQYYGAVTSWENSSNRMPLSLWMKKAFDEEFTPFWMTTHIADAQVGMGLYQEGRERLQEASNGASKEQLDAINLYMGMSFIKQGEEKNTEAAIPYYKLAMKYLEQVPMDDPRFTIERNQILDLVSEEINTLVGQRSLNKLPFFISLVEKWSGEDHLKQITNSLVVIFNQEIEQENWSAVQEVTVLLSEILPEGDVRRTLLYRFEKMIDSSLQSGDLDSLQRYWEIIKILNPNTTDLAQRYSQEVMRRVPFAVKQDDDNLTVTRQYINFWKRLVHDPEEQYDYAESLLMIARDLWVNGSYQKGTALILLAAELPTGKQQVQFHDDVASIIQFLYDRSIEIDNINEAASILDIVQQLNLIKVEMGEPAEVATHLQDAQYLYRDEQFNEAKRKAAWVLILEPENNQARKLVGMIYYQEGEYDKALPYLRRLEGYDQEAVRALATAELLAGRSIQGYQLLEGIKESASLNDEMILRLAFGNIIKGDPDAALFWLEKLDEENDEVIIGKSFAFYDLKKWENVLNEISKLSQPYNRLDAIRGLEVLTLLNQGDEKLAQKKLIDLVKESHPKVNVEYSQPFNLFKKERLEPINQWYIGGRYYASLGNPQKSIEYFQQLVNPTLLQRIERAEIYQQVGNFEEAGKDFAQVIKDVDSLAAKKQVKTSLAEYYAKMGYYADAFEIYRTFYLEEPNDLKFCIPFARVAMAVKRYDVAVEQFQLLFDKNMITDDAMPEFFQALTKAALFDRASQLMKVWLHREEQPTVLNQLQAVPSLFILRDFLELKTVLAIAEGKKDRTLEENIALIDGWIITTQYVKAEKLLEELHSQLIQDPDGLMAMARLKVQLSEVKAALDFAYQAQKLKPHDAVIMQFIIQHERRPEILEEWIRVNEKGQEHLSERIALARNLINLFVEKLSILETLNNEELKRLYRAKEIAKTLVSETKKFPEVYYLLGLTQNLLHDVVDAHKSFNKALELDPSFVDAYRNLILIYLDNNQLENAIKAAYQVVRFDPKSGHGWQQLANLVSEDGNTLDAIEFLRESISHQPKEVDPYIELSKLLIEVNNPEGAEDVLKEALEVHPSNDKVIQALEHLLERDTDLLNAHTPDR